MVMRSTATAVKMTALVIAVAMVWWAPARAVMMAMMMPVMPAPTAVRPVVVMGSVRAKRSAMMVMCETIMAARPAVLWLAVVMGFAGRIWLPRMRVMRNVMTVMGSTRTCAPTPVPWLNVATAFAPSLRNAMTATMRTATAAVTSVSGLAAATASSRLEKAAMMATASTTMPAPTHVSSPAAAMA